MSRDALRVLTVVDKMDPAAGVDSEVLERDRFLIEDAVRNRGYLDAQIDTRRVTGSPGRLYRATHFVEVTFPIHEESRYRFGKLTAAEHDAHGRAVVPLGGKSLRARFSQHDGDWFGRGALILELQNLQTL